MSEPTAPRRPEPGAPRRPEELRSHQWYGTDGLRSFSHRARTRQLGYLPEEHLGKPVIAVLNTWSDINPCHVHLPTARRP
ncbi:dihydroxy-acid dehydratase [Streptomyces narbonensis]